ncbi:MAG: hypothetical protein JXK08_04505 [Flavobacteriaceae bacterium]|nr:hypothetical protein [Flavobacteriaceae bacterium]
MKKQLILILLTLFTVFSFSQNAILSSTETDEDGNVIDQNQELAIVSNVVNSNQQNGSQLQLSSKNVYVTQIGDYNTIEAVVSAPKYNVDLNQVGDNNLIDVKLKATKFINYEVLQVGNDNKVIDYNFGTQKVINSSFNQIGDNLKIENYGSNSISEKLQINMTGQSRTITINNYN